MAKLSKTVQSMELKSTSSVDISQSDLEQGFCPGPDNFPGLAFDSGKCVELSREMYNIITAVEAMPLPFPFMFFSFNVLVKKIQLTTVKNLFVHLDQTRDIPGFFVVVSLFQVSSHSFTL